MQPDRPRDCDACPLPERREFIARLATSLAAIGMLSGTTELFAQAVTPSQSAGALKSYSVPEADGVQIDRDAEVILVRSQKYVYAFALSCPHQNTALRWNAADNRFQCPKHKSKYRVDGSFIEGRATRAMDRYGVSLQGALVVVNLDVVHKQDADPAGWNSALVTLP